MKINEVLNEGPFLNKIGTAVGNAVGTAAKGAGALAGGIAGIPSAVKKGFAAGKSTVAGAGDEQAAAATPAANATAQPTATATPATTTASQPTVATPAAAPAGKAGGSMLGSLATGAVKAAAALGHKDSQQAAAFVNADADQQAQVAQAKQDAQANAPGANAFGQMASQLTKEPGAPAQAAAQPTAPAGMTKDQILQWIGRNSEDYTTLKSFADGIGVADQTPPAAQPAPAAPAKAAAPTFNAGNIMKTIPGAAKKPAAPTPNFGGPTSYGQTTTTMKPTAAPTKPAATV